MASAASNAHLPGTPPWEALRERLLSQAEAMRAVGDNAGATVLHALVESWWRDQQAWDLALRDALRAHHEINNALVGVSGNVQLLLMTPAGQQPGVKERLQVILREAGRVERAAHGLQDAKVRLGFSSDEPGHGGSAHGGHSTHVG